MLGKGKKPVLGFLELWPELRFVFFLSFLGVFLLAPVSVRAGFEWTPSSTKNVTEAVSPTLMPVPVMSESIHDVGIIDVPPMNSSPEIDARPLWNGVPEQLTDDSEPVPFFSDSGVSTIYEDKSSYEEIVGFGNDIPLALAMNQIIPPGYSYSFDSTVDPGLRVSWNGGKSWDVVLTESLAPFGFDALVTARTVVVHPLVSDISALPDPVVPMSQPEPETVMEMAYVEELTLSSFVTPLPHSYADTNEESSPEEPYVQSYPRRNPVPFMMKAQGEGVASGAPQNLNTNVSSVAYAESIPPFSETLPLSEPFSDFEEPVPVEMPMEGQETSSRPSYERITSSPDGKPMDPFEIRFWQAESGTTLKAALAEWAEMAGVDVFWGSSYDYTLPAPIRMHGTFPDAVTRILTVYADLEPRPLGRLHPNLPTGPSVLVIENYNPQ